MTRPSPVGLSSPVNATHRQLPSGVGTILNDDTVAGIVALSERNPVMIVDAMSWFVSDSESHGEHADHDHLGHGKQDHQQSPSRPCDKRQPHSPADRCSFQTPVRVSCSGITAGSGYVAAATDNSVVDTEEVSGKASCGIRQESELTAFIQTAANSQQKALEVLFAEPELLQSLWQRHG